MKHDVRIGDIFHRLTVIGFSKDKRNVTNLVCKCECGNTKVIDKCNLVLGKTQSCGCLHRERAVESNVKGSNQYVFTDGYVIGKLDNSGNEFYIDKEDYEKVKALRWYEGKNGYITHKTHNKYIYLHRFLMNPPDGLVVDHINHNKRDNRRTNLRVCTNAENCQNRRVQPKGIVIAKRGNRKYYVVYFKGKYVGCYKNYDQAKRKRDELFEEIT